MIFEGSCPRSDLQLIARPSQTQAGTVYAKCIGPQQHHSVLNQIFCVRPNKIRSVSLTVGEYTGHSIWLHTCRYVDTYGCFLVIFFGVFGWGWDSVAQRLANNSQMVLPDFQKPPYGSFQNQLPCYRPFTKRHPQTGLISTPTPSKGAL